MQSIEFLPIIVNVYLIIFNDNILSKENNCWRKMTPQSFNVFYFFHIGKCGRVYSKQQLIHTYPSLVRLFQLRGSSFWAK